VLWLRGREAKLLTAKGRKKEGWNGENAGATNSGERR
jgi:hypothetical protein